MTKDDEIKRLKSALQKIANLDSFEINDDDGEEYGETECFYRAQDIAREALK